VLDDDDFDDGEQIKETFAYFGRAYYMANVFETGLAISIMQLDFLVETRKRYVAERPKTFDRPKYEADFDAFMDHQHAKTLGNLIKSACKFSEISHLIEPHFQNAKNQRDYLAHHFFRERALEFSSRRGRERLILELDELHDVFEHAGRLLDEAMAPHRKMLGVTPEMQAQMMDKFRKESEELSDD